MIHCSIRVSTVTSNKFSILQKQELRRGKLCSYITYRIINESVTNLEIIEIELVFCLCSI